MTQERQMPDKAIILTNGELKNSDAKTAHGLIRGTKRFDIAGVIDTVSAGQDAGVVLDGLQRNIPVFANITDFIAQADVKPVWAVIGVALAGGRLGTNWEELLLEVLENRIGIINGLHQSLSTVVRLKAAADRNQVRICDIRKPRPIEELHYWSGKVYDVTVPRIAVLGMDCAVGKRTTCQMLMTLCEAGGIRTELIYTGQTGWMLGYGNGFILDATPNDFVSGEIERAIMDCARQSAPDLMLLEGQSGFRNPSGPCGAEILLSGDVKGVIMVHAPFRTHYVDHESAGCIIPTVESEIELIRMHGAETLAVVLNTETGEPGRLKAYQQDLATKLKLPVIRPIEEGVDRLLPVIRDFIANP